MRSREETVGTGIALSWDGTVTDCGDRALPPLLGSPEGNRGPAEGEEPSQRPGLR